MAGKPGLYSSAIASISVGMNLDIWRVTNVEVREEMITNVLGPVRNRIPVMNVSMLHSLEEPS